MATVLRQRWRQQPKGPVIADLGNPLTAGLIWLDNPALGYLPVFSMVTGATLTSVGSGNVFREEFIRGGRTYYGDNGNRHVWEFGSSNLATLLAGQEATLLQFIYNPNGATANQGFSRFGTSGQFSHYQFSGTTYIDAFRTTRESFGVEAAVFARPHLIAVTASAARNAWKFYQEGREQYGTTASWGLFSAPTLYGNDAVGSVHSGYASDVMMSALFARALLASEVRALAENPWQLFRPRRSIIYSIFDTNPNPPSSATLMGQAWL